MNESWLRFNVPKGKYGFLTVPVLVHLNAASSNLVDLDATFIWDTGAAYTLIPYRTLKSLGYTKLEGEVEKVRLADGSEALLRAVKVRDLTLSDSRGKTITFSGERYIHTIVPGKYTPNPEKIPRSNFTGLLGMDFIGRLESVFSVPQKGSTDLELLVLHRRTGEIKVQMEFGGNVDNIIYGAYNMNDIPPTELTPSERKILLFAKITNEMIFTNYDGFKLKNSGGLTLSEIQQALASLIAYGYLVQDGDLYYLTEFGQALPVV